MASGNPVNEVQTLLGATPTGGSGGSSAVTEQLTSLTQQLQQLQTINQQQIETEQENTRALAQNTTTKASGGSGSGIGSVGSTIESVLGFGLGLSPLISGLVSLFGGSGQTQPAPLVPYVKPPSVAATAGISASQAGAFGVDTADGGLPRAQPGSTSQSTTQSTTQITVQVQAMDSQSFLDHSNDIAQAVRQAMLESTTLNDVIRAV